MVDSINAKAGLSVGDFKAGINEINRDLRVLNSEFRASAATMGDWSKSATGLEDHISLLNKSIDLQKDKVEKLKAQQAQMAAEGKLTAAAQDEMTIKINKATEELNRMQRELGEDQQSLDAMKTGSDQAGESVQQLGEKTQDASGGLDTFKSVAGGLATALKATVATVTALAGAVAAVGGAIAGLVINTASSVDEMNDLSTKTGISTTRLQELNYAATLLGSSQDTVVSSMARMTRSMAGAQKEQADYNAKVAEARAAGKEYSGSLGTSAAAFAEIGVATTDASGNLRDSEAVFADLLTALGKIPNEAERDALSMQIFGKNAQELNPLIKAGAGELAKLSAEAHTVGAVISDENVGAFAKFQDTLDSLKMGLQGTLGTLAAAFLPGFQIVFDQAGGYLKTFTSIVSGANGDFGKMAEGMTGLIQQIITDISAQAPGLLQSGLTIIQTILQSITNALPTTLPVMIELIQSLISFLVENLPMLLDAGVQVLLSLVSGILTALPDLVTAALKMIVTLADGLTAAMPKMIPMLATVIPQIITAIMDNLPLIIQAALNLIMALLQGIQQATPQLYAAMPVLVKAMFDALIIIAPMLSEAGIELIKLLGRGIWDSVPLMTSAMGGIVTEIFSGLYRGFVANMPKFLAQVKAFFSDVVKAAKSALGISSPSTIFAAEVGAQIPPGVGVGIRGAMPALQRDLGAAMSGLARDYNIGVTANLGGAVGDRLGGSAPISFGNIYVDARGAKDPQAVGQVVGDGILSRLRASGAY